MTDLQQWMEDNAVSTKELAEYLGYAKGTVYNWRSDGIPPERMEWVEEMLARWEKMRRHIPQRLMLEITDEQFDRFNRLAMEEGMLLRDWILKSLVDVADDEMKIDYRNRQQENSILVSEKKKDK